MSAERPERHLLLTGATGCVGHYVVEDLLLRTPHRLTLVVRDLARVPRLAVNHERVRLIEADARDVEAYAGRIGRVDAGILIAAAWGGPEAEEVNHLATLKLLQTLDRLGAERALYFSTASVLARDGALLKAADDLGTEYIRSKYRLVADLADGLPSLNLVGLFPTLVVGGGSDRPMSHLSKLLVEAAPWAGLAARFRVDGRFHFIHAQDIATVVREMIDRPHAIARRPPERHVLGVPVVEATAIIDAFAAQMGKRRRLRWTLRQWQADLIIRLFRIQLSGWDRYCIDHRDLSYDRVVNPVDFGLPLHCPDLGAAMREIGLGSGKA